VYQTQGLEGPRVRNGGISSFTVFEKIRPQWTKIGNIIRVFFLKFSYINKYLLRIVLLGTRVLSDLSSGWPEIAR